MVESCEGDDHKSVRELGLQVMEHLVLVLAVDEVGVHLIEDRALAAHRQSTQNSVANDMGDSNL